MMYRLQAIFSCLLEYVLSRYVLMSCQKKADEEDAIKMAALAEKMAAKNTRGRQGLAAQLAGGGCGGVCGGVCCC